MNNLSSSAGDLFLVSGRRKYAQTNMMKQIGAQKNPALPRPNMSARHHTLTHSSTRLR